MTIYTALRSSVKSFLIKDLLFIVIGIMSLAAIAVPLTIIFLSKRKEMKVVKVWARSEPATKYRELHFDRHQGVFVIEADVFFTAKNNCPIHFTSRDGKDIKADIHFRYTVLERDFKDSKTVVYIESQSRKILTEELEKLTVGMDSENLDSHSFRNLRAIRPLFKERMSEFVSDVEHLFLIGEMKIIKNSIPT